MKEKFESRYHNFVNKDLLVVLSFLLSFVAFYFSYIHYKQLLPLSQSNVVFSESDIVITNLLDRDIVEPHFRNIGKAQAKDLQLQVFAVPFDENIDVNTSGQKVIKLFDNKLIEYLEPDTKSSFGNFYIRLDQTNLGHKEALIFCIKYYDSIDNSNPYYKMFFFVQQIGANKVNSLTSDDYPKIKTRLGEYLSNNPNICPKDVYDRNFIKS